MKKKMLLRGLLGAPIGLAVSHLITVAFSLAWGDGNYYPVVPELLRDVGSETGAVLLQTLCAMLCGGVFAGASAIWEMEPWSLLRMTVTHLAVCSVGTLPIAYLMYWMPHTPAGIALYFALFFGIYLLIWVAQYFGTKRRLQKMNVRLRAQQ